MKISVTILLVALVSKGYSQLTCYQCQDCSEIGNDLKAIQCGLAEDPTQTTTTTTTTIDPPAESVDPGITSEPAPSTPESSSQTAAPALDYRCYTAQIQTNGTVRLNRGCVQYKQTDTETCKTINNNVYLCELCNANECNSATGLVTSAILILSALLVISLRLS